MATDFFGNDNSYDLSQGGNLGAAGADPDDQPNPANPGGISNNELRRRQRQLDASANRTANVNAANYDRNASQVSTPAMQQQAYENGNIGGVTGAANARTARNVPQADAVAAYQIQGGDGRQLSGQGGVPYENRGASANPQNALGAAPGFATLDRSGYDRTIADLDQARGSFLDELDRLSGTDPFGNQALIRKATDRSVAQSAALASGGLSTATARAGNMRQAQGQQAAMSAQGRDQLAEQATRDAALASQQRIAASQGLSNQAIARGNTEADLAKAQANTLSQNLDAWIKYTGINLQLQQADVENLRNAAVELSKLDASVRDQDADRVLQKYDIDERTKVALKQIAAQNQGMSVGDTLMNLAGLGLKAAPVVAGLASDRRAKFDVRDPDLRDLQDFLGKTKGKLYRYKDPHKSGRREGLNFGPMAQDLAASKIGATLVAPDADGTLKVDTARLALADHAALAAVAAEVRELRDALANKGGKSSAA